MTPMIDVTFQLLLFFLLTCEFRPTEGMIPGSLPSNGPLTGAKLDPVLDPITIRLLPSADLRSARYELTGAIGAISTPRELGERLRTRQQQLGSRDVPVLIMPADGVPWEFVVEAFNQAKKASFTKIGFARDIG